MFSESTSKDNYKVVFLEIYSFCGFSYLLHFRVKLPENLCGRLMLINIIIFFFSNHFETNRPQNDF